MTLRSRIALLAAGAVAVAVVAVASVVFAVTRSELRRGIDRSLERFAVEGGGVRVIARGPATFDREVVGGIEPPPELQLAVQFLTVEGELTSVTSDELSLPVSERDILVARGAAPAFLRDVTVAGQHLRMITAPSQAASPFFEEVGAVQAARSLSEVDASLRNLTVLLVLVALGGVGLAAALGLLIARSALRPVGKLTEAAEQVARTQDLDAAITVERPDEVGRLAGSFNAMLRALKRSRAQQHQLVTDAGHELRTPLTSVRTNVEVLARNRDMDPVERARVLADLNAEMEELTNLVNELVDLATAEGSTDEEETDVRLDEVGGLVVERARRRSGQRIDFEATPCVVHGRPTQIERAASNIVDNACKWNRNGDAIEVSVGDGRFEVHDYGPGIGADDLPHVFDRFYRAPAARSMPGSGLGLAIVKQVVETHGGRVWATDADDGGAIVGFELPVIGRATRDPESKS